MRASAQRTALLFSSSAICALIALPAAAQETEELPPLVVEGATIDKPKTKISKPKAGAPQDISAGVVDTGVSPQEAGTTETATGVPIDQVGTAVTVVTGAQLKAQQVRTVADALRSLPGVSVSRTGTQFGITQIRMRGAESNHTLVLIDGIEANNTTNGEWDFSDLSTDGIERIEVLRGSQSGLYGSGAIGGVINIITAGGRGPLTLRASAEGGSFNTSEVRAGISAGNDDGYFKFSAAKLRTDGFNIAAVGPEKDGGELSTFAFAAGLNATKDIGVDITFRHIDKEGDRDAVGGTGLQVATDDPLSTMASTTTLAGIRAHWDMLDGALTHAVHANRLTNTTDDNDFSFPAFPYLTSNESERNRYGYTLTYRFDTPALMGASHSLTGMIEQQEEYFTPQGDGQDNIEREGERLALVAEYRGEFADRLFVTGSVRNDDTSEFGEFTTWRTTATLQLPEIGLRPHASAGTGMKAPTFFERYGQFPNFFTPNPDLIPEESFGWDAGVEFTLLAKRAAIDITYFETEIENQITLGFTTADNLLGISEHKGVEIAARYQLTPSLLLGGSYTYLDSRQPDGLESLRRPKHTGRADLTYTFDHGRGQFNLAAIYNGDFVDRATDGMTFTPVRVDMDSYWLVSAAASYQVAPGVDVYGRIENLLDEDYQEIFGYETPGLGAYAGLRFKFEEPSSVAWSQGR